MPTFVSYTSPHFPCPVELEKIPHILPFHSQILQYGVLKGDDHLLFKDKQSGFFPVFRRQKSSNPLLFLSPSHFLFYSWGRLLEEAANNRLLVPGLLLLWEAKTKVCLRNASKLASQNGLHSQATISLARERHWRLVNTYNDLLSTCYLSTCTDVIGAKGESHSQNANDLTWEIEPEHQFRVTALLNSFSEHTLTKLGLWVAETSCLEWKVPKSDSDWEVGGHTSSQRKELNGRARPSFLKALPSPPHPRQTHVFPTTPYIFKSAQVSIFCTRKLPSNLPNEQLYHFKWLL